MSDRDLLKRDREDLIDAAFIARAIFREEPSLDQGCGAKLTALLALLSSRCRASLRENVQTPTRP